MQHEMEYLKVKTININMFIDADNSYDHETRLSITGVLMLLNKTSILWYSKSHNTMETCTCGS